jgi:hypothetical protein
MHPTNTRISGFYDNNDNDYVQAPTCVSRVYSRLSSETTSLCSSPSPTTSKTKPCKTKPSKMPRSSFEPDRHKSSTCGHRERRGCVSICGTNRLCLLKFSFLLQIERHKRILKSLFHEPPCARRLNVETLANTRIEHSRMFPVPAVETLHPYKSKPDLTPFIEPKVIVASSYWTPDLSHYA